MKIRQTYRELAVPVESEDVLANRAALSPSLAGLLQQTDNALHMTENFSEGAGDAWRAVRLSCQELQINFGHFLGHKTRFGRSFLEYIVESDNIACCSFIHSTLPNGVYASGEIVRTDTLLVTSKDRDERAHGYQKLPRNGYYQGDFFEGYRDGQGKFDINVGSVYLGEFKKSRYHGYGKMISKTNPAESYEGLFIDGHYAGDLRQKKQEEKSWSLKRIGRMLGG